MRNAAGAYVVLDRKSRSKQSLGIMIARRHGIAGCRPVVAVVFHSLVAAWLVASTLAADIAADPFAGAQSRFAKLGTNKVHYLSLGRGTRTVVLVHGWGGSVNAWRLQAPALREKARLLILDLPGHGKSDKPHTAYGTEFYANAIGAVMKDAQVTKATLVGFSLGTPVICRFYRQSPASVDGLVAVDGALRGFTMTTEQMDSFLAPYKGAEYREAAAKFIGAMFPSPETASLRDRTLEDVRATPQHVMVSSFEGMFDKTAWELDKIDVPLLVVNAKSPFWSSEYEAFVRKLQPKVDYRVIEGTGHFLMLEKPSEFNAALLEFLNH